MLGVRPPSPPPDLPQADLALVLGTVPWLRSSHIQLQGLRVGTQESSDGVLMTNLALVFPRPPS